MVMLVLNSVVVNFLLFDSSFFVKLIILQLICGIILGEYNKYPYGPMNEVNPYELCIVNILSNE